MPPRARKKPSPGPRKRPGDLRSRALGLVEALRQAYPEAGCTLDFRTPVELLVATILSAQCTDERVNALTPELFRRFPDAGAFAGAGLSELEQAIRPTGFFRNKARSIQGACRALVSEHGGQVPATMESLTRLPGVGRKTANVLRAACFGEQAVIVDTHVKRVAGRLGLTRSTDPDVIELDLMKVLPDDSLSFASQALILHGRQVCKARRPRCSDCALAFDCPSREAEA